MVFESEHFVGTQNIFRPLEGICDETLANDLSAIENLSGKPIWYVSPPEDSADLLYEIRHRLPNSTLNKGNPHAEEIIERSIDQELESQRQIKSLNSLPLVNAAVKGFDSVYFSEVILLCTESFEFVPFETKFRAAYLHINNLRAYGKVMPFIYEQYLLNHALNFCQHYSALAATQAHDPSEALALIAQIEMEINLSLGSYETAKISSEKMLGIAKDLYNDSGLSDALFDHFLNFYTPVQLKLMDYLFKQKFSGNSRTKWSIANAALLLNSRFHNLPLYKVALKGLDLINKSRQVRRCLSADKVKDFKNTLGTNFKRQTDRIERSSYFEDPLFKHFVNLERSYIHS